MAFESGTSGVCIHRPVYMFITRISLKYIFACQAHTGMRFVIVANNCPCLFKSLSETVKAARI